MTSDCDFRFGDINTILTNFLILLYLSVKFDEIHLPCSTYIMGKNNILKFSAVPTLIP